MTTQDIRTITGPLGNWTSIADLDPATGDVLFTIYNSNGRTVYQSNADSVISSIRLNSEFKSQPAFFNNLIGTVGTQQITLQTQYTPQSSPPASAGQVAATSSTTQNPPVGQQVVNADGSVSTANPNTVKTNAVAFGATSNIASAPPTLPGNTSGITSGTTTQPGTRPATNSVFPGTQNQNAVSYIYRATEVISVFSKGKFTQELNGAQIYFDAPPNTTGESIAVTDTETFRSTTASSTTAQAGVQTLQERQATAGYPYDSPQPSGNVTVTTNTQATGPAKALPPTSNGQSVAIPTTSPPQPQQMSPERVAEIQRQILEGRKRLASKTPGGPIITQTISKEF